MRATLGKLYRRYLPSHFQSWLDCQRAKSSWRSAKVIFIHVPKVAGFSLSTALYGKRLGHIRACDIKNNLPIEFDSCFKFAFVRHPVTRFFSAFSYLQENYDLLEGGPGLPPKEVAFLDPYEFIDLWLSSCDISHSNFIFRPQSDFIFDENDQLLVDTLYRYESFQDGISDLSLRIPSLRFIENLNRSGSEKISYDFCEIDRRLRLIYPRDYSLLGY